MEWYQKKGQLERQRSTRASKRCTVLQLQTKLIMRLDKQYPRALRLYEKCREVSNHSELGHRRRLHEWKGLPVAQISALQPVHGHPRVHQNMRGVHHYERVHKGASQTGHTKTFC